MLLRCMAPGLLSLMLLLALPAQAAVLKDDALQALLDQGRIDDVLRETRNRSDGDALAAQALALLQSREPLAQSVRAAEACVARHPETASCHYALGSALGEEAQRSGVLRGLRLVGRVRDAFARAVTLDPAMFEARSALQLIYLVLPGVAGGSVDKATELALQVRDSQPEVAKLLRARLAVQAKRWDEAERELASVQLGRQPSFHAEVVTAWAGLARQWNRKDLHARSRARFEQLVRQLPELAAPQYQLGRTLADEGRAADALVCFEKARSLRGARALPLEHRIGVAWMDLGDKARAREHLQRFVQDPRAHPNNLEDARKRLQQLG